MTTPPLIAPDWLVERAAQDDPPTEIAPRLLKRLRAAGVDELVPALRGENVMLPVEEADRANAIGAVGPGIPFAESLEDEAAPVGAALVRLLVFLEGFDKLRRFRLAAIDMRLAESTAQALADRDGPTRFFARVLETGLIVTYARPYLTRHGAMGGKWLPEGDEARSFHRQVIEQLRNPFHAHADRSNRRTLVETASWFGLDQPSRYAEAVSQLTDEQLSTLAEIAAAQAERFEAEADRLGEAIGEHRDA